LHDKLGKTAPAAFGSAPANELPRFFAFWRNPKRAAALSLGPIFSLNGICDGVTRASPADTAAFAALRPADKASQGSLRALNWFSFFVADIQAGFGPFIAAFLTAQSWSQGHIGIALTVGSLVGLATQVPAGALVDAIPGKRRLAMIGVVGISISAVLIAVWPVFSVVVAAEILHAIATCVLGPATIAISLGLVGYAHFSDRLARNVRYAALGNGITAFVYAIGSLVLGFGYTTIFFLTAALGVPALVALSQIRKNEIDLISARGGALVPRTDTLHGLAELSTNSALMILATAVVLFQLANAALLPFMASALVAGKNEQSILFVSAMIVGPQLVGSAISGWVGRQVERVGRRPLLMLAFAPLPVRGLVLAFSSDPYVITLVQLLDGISAATIGILVPLVIADVTRGSGHFNLAQGVVATAVGIGAAFSTTLAGYTVDDFGYRAAFLMLMGVGAIGFLLVFAVMPETKPKHLPARVQRAAVQ
jgi:MFS family permease